MTSGGRSFVSASTLGARLGSTLLLALLPLGILSVAQTREAQTQAEASALEGVGGAALKAVAAPIKLITEAQIAARVLASVLSQSMNEGTACVERVKAVARDIEAATIVAYVPKSGLVTCTSNGQSHFVGDNPQFRDMVAKPQPSLAYDPYGDISKMAVIGISHPVFDKAGDHIGLVAISLAYSAVAPGPYMDAVGAWQPSYIGTFEADGSLLLASDPDVDPASLIPGGISAERLAALAGKPGYIEGPDGHGILSVVSIAQDLYLVSLWQREAKGFWTRAGTASPYLLPALTWVAALVVAAFASSRLVVRHVRALSRSMSDYVRSHARVQIPDIGDAPTEIQHLHSAYEQLILTIEQEEAELQNLLVDKDMLLREVNHRNGNSLQVIASIMRMYRREATDPKLKAVLDSLINRVIALASTHSSLYALSDLRDVPIDEVLTNVIRRLKEIHGVRLGVAIRRFQPLRLDPQSSVPLALALAEAIGCYFLRPNLDQGEVTVSLSAENGSICLALSGPTVEELRPETQAGMTSLPQRMLRQFAAQLGGHVAIATEGDRTRVDLVFPGRVG